MLLTSAHTLSAAEELAYDLQALKRATIVGETTSGQAHATFEARIDNHFEILLPTGKTLNPVTGADWEGVGVIPDVKVSATDALATAHAEDGKVEEACGFARTWLQGQSVSEQKQAAKRIRKDPQMTALNGSDCYQSVLADLGLR